MLQIELTLVCGRAGRRGRRGAGGSAAGGGREDGIGCRADNGGDGEGEDVGGERGSTAFQTSL